MTTTLQDLIENSDLDADTIEKISTAYDAGGISAIAAIKFALHEVGETSYSLEFLNSFFDGTTQIIVDTAAEEGRDISMHVPTDEDVRKLVEG